MPMETERDTPPILIVKACEAIGIKNGEDVRWTRVCRCRERVPHPLPKYRFTYANGEEVTLGVYQCNRCLTVYWSE